MKSPHSHIQQSAHAASGQSIRAVLDTITFVVGLDDLRKRCPGYDTDFFDQVLLQLERDGELVIAEGKVFPVRTSVDRAEIIQFPGQLPGESKRPHKWD